MSPALKSAGKVIYEMLKG